MLQFSLMLKKTRVHRERGANVAQDHKGMMIVILDFYNSMSSIFLIIFDFY